MKNNMKNDIKNNVKKNVKSKTPSKIKDVRKYIEFRDSSAFILSIEQGGTITHVSRKAADYLSEEDYAYLDGEAYRFFRGLSSLHPRLKKYLEPHGMEMLRFVV